MRFQRIFTGLAGALLAGVTAAMIGQPLAATPAPQKGGGGITGAGGVESSVMGDEGARPMTPFEEFADKLKLDQKTQAPAVRELFNAAASNAAPIGVELLQLRQQLLNVERKGQTSEAKPLMDAITAASAKMARIEATTFVKVYGLLKPNQQAKAPQAFAQMAGFFQSTPNAGGRGGR